MKSYKIINSAINDKKILDVGVGSGNEATILFSNCKDITFVDIAPIGLQKIKDKIKYYPSFAIFKDGEIVDYLDANSEEDIEIYKKY